MDLCFSNTTCLFGEIAKESEQSRARQQADI
jgi:hypothetical protein